MSNLFYELINKSTISTRFDVIMSKTNKKYIFDKEDKQFSCILFGSINEFGANFINGVPSNDDYTLIIEQNTSFINVSHIIKQFRRNDKLKLTDITSQSNYIAIMKLIEKIYNEDNKDNIHKLKHLRSYDSENDSLKGVFKVNSKKPYDGVYMHPDILDTIIEYCNPNVSDEFDELLYSILLKQGINDNITLNNIIDEQLNELKSSVNNTLNNEIDDKIMTCCKYLTEKRMKLNEKLNNIKNKSLKITNRRVIFILDRYFDKEGQFDNESSSVSFKVRILYEGDSMNNKIEYYELDENDYINDNDEKDHYKIIRHYYIARDVKHFNYDIWNDFLDEYWNELNIYRHYSDNERYCVDDYDRFIGVLDKYIREDRS